ncbi:MAG: DUF1592 domain-containing protein [Pseudomonadota bacterium]
MLALAGCTGGVVVEENGPDGVNAGSGLGPGSSGMDPSSGGASGQGGSMVPSMGGGATSAPVGGSTAMGSGGNSTGPAGGSTGMPGGATPSMDCTAITPGPSPLRRLTTHEYNNTVRDLLGDTTSPGHALPAQADSKHNLFGNDANEQTPSPLLVEKYQSVAEGIAARATEGAALGRLHPCATNVTPQNEEACARSIASTIAPRAWRRVVSAEETEELVELYRSVRALSSSVTFASGVAAMLEALLQSPEFLYRVEHGVADSSNPAVRRIVGREMATRLSYLLWQTMPDEALFQAADAGMLDTPDGVLSQARAMLRDPRARSTVAFFFDNLLPIPDLPALTRDPELFPTFSSQIGVAMRQEVQRLLEYEIFENTTQEGTYPAGSWPALLTAPYTFVNEALFAYYGSNTFAPGTTVSGNGFHKVSLNTNQRLGLLTLGGVTAGGTTSNRTNPVLRGTFVLNKLMCFDIQVPPGLSVAPPEPYTGKTARERFTKHSEDPTCAACHRQIDPVGFAFENYDAVGLYRETERWVDPMTNVVYDTPIDASGSVPGVDGTAKNAVELVQLLATSPQVGSCFASHWMQFAYGRSLDRNADACNIHEVETAFAGASYDIKTLLLALTQTDAFLYRSTE